MIATAEGSQVPHPALSGRKGGDRDLFEDFFAHRTAVGSAGRRRDPARGNVLRSGRAEWQLGILAATEIDEDWVGAAICSQTDPELFHPKRGSNGADAKRICRDCPSRLLCLRWALDNDEPKGVWGGLNRSERHRLLRDASGWDKIEQQSGLAG